MDPKRFKTGLTQSRLCDLFSYDRDTGLFIRKVRVANAMPGEVASCKMANGYIVIRVDGQIYLAHRLAWLYVTGSFPSYELDHKDGNPSNNAILNLRPATRLQNCRNVRIAKSNTSGVKGVSWSKQKKKWSAQISFKNKIIHLGLFVDIEQAAQAYKRKATELFEEFVR